MVRYMLRGSLPFLNAPETNRSEVGIEPTFFFVPWQLAQMRLYVVLPRLRLFASRSAIRPA